MEPLDWSRQTAPNAAYECVLSILNALPKNEEGLLFGFLADIQPDAYAGFRLVFPDGSISKGCAVAVLVASQKKNNKPDKGNNQNNKTKKAKKTKKEWLRAILLCIIKCLIKIIQMFNMSDEGIIDYATAVEGIDYLYMNEDISRQEANYMFNLLGHADSMDLADANHVAAAAMELSIPAERLE